VKIAYSTAISSVCGCHEQEKKQRDDDRGNQETESHRRPQQTVFSLTGARYVPQKGAILELNVEILLWFSTVVLNVAKVWGLNGRGRGGAGEQGGGLRKAVGSGEQVEHYRDTL
jgi:hypothetical protein